ncbi:hypothetical protein [Streptomyces sp. NPDC002851]
MADERVVGVFADPRQEALVHGEFGEPGGQHAAEQPHRVTYRKRPTGRGRRRRTGYG